VRLVRPDPHAIAPRDLGIANGRWARAEPALAAALAREVFDARAMTVAAERPDYIRLERWGFGGTEDLLSGVFSEGSRRPMADAQVAELLACNPAQRFGRARCNPFIHSYPQVFPYPQPTHILGITELRTPTHGGDPVRSEAEKVHVDWGLRFD
jgi:hypothetical protein